MNVPIFTNTTITTESKPKENKKAPNDPSIFKFITPPTAINIPDSIALQKRSNIIINRHIDGLNHQGLSQKGNSLFHIPMYHRMIQGLENYPLA